MYTRSCGPRARLYPLFLSATLALASTHVRAAPLVGFDFDDGTGGFRTAPTFVAEGLAVTPWQAADGNLTSLAGATGRAAAATGWHDGNAFGFLLEVLPGWRAALSEFGFLQRASASGPQDWTLRVGTIDAASGVTSTTLSSRTGPLALADLQGVVPVALTGAGAGTASGSWRIDDFVLGGRLERIVIEPPPVGVPAPAPLTLAGAILLALCAAQRRPVMRTATQPARDTNPR